MAIAEQEISGDTNPIPDATTNGHAPQRDERGLILDSLEIKNFRAFRHLVIPKLGRVNLITGKNGVGKSSLLEALYLYAHSASPQAVRQVLLDRREVLNGGSDADSLATSPRVNLQALFYQIDRDQLTQGLSIGVSRTITTDYRSYVLKFELISEPASWFSNDKVQVHGAFGDKYEYSALTPQNGVSQTGQSLVPGSPELACSRLTANIPDGNSLAAQWDEVALTSSEDAVLRVVRLINTKIQRVAFVAERQSPLGRIAMVKAAGMERPISMARFGDGLTRAFACALSLTESENGILLIDEIENGLHFSMLPEVWRLIFVTARRLNVQVFATTHSWDCIEAFQQAAAEDDDPESGVLVRLQNEDGDVAATVFDERRLAIVTREGIEVR